MRSLLTHALLVIDLVSMKLFLWALGKKGELLDSNLFFFDRYSDLSAFHRQRGSAAKADRFTAIAEAHFNLAPDDDDGPEAAAMAMPVPRPPVFTDAVSRLRVINARAGRRQQTVRSQRRGPRRPRRPSHVH